MKNNSYLFLFCFGLSIVFLGVSYGEESNPPKDLPREEKVITAIPLKGKIKLDGILDEPSWEKCVPAKEFLQREPLEGQSSTEHTEVRVLYTTQTLYIGVRCSTENSGKIIARYQRRDSSVWNDDSIHIMLDPFANGQTGFMFSTNALGARFDATISGFQGQSGGRSGRAGQRASPNEDWNGIWNVKTQIHDTGWSAEFEIPFATLKFPRQEEQIWGINLRRMIPANNEEALWTAYPKSFGFYALTQAGKLKGLSNLKQGLGLDVKPYILTKHSIERQNQHDEDITSEVGLDLSYSITTNIQADLTINPDFAETEVDEQPLNLTRFPVFFPEKRKFFLEGASVFEFGSPYRGTPYFSRRIGLDEDRRPVPILLGSKITGTEGNTSFGFLNAITDQHEDTPSTLFNVMRVQQRIFEESNIGAIVTNKMPDGGDQNHVGGIDGSFIDSYFMGDKQLRADFFAMQSYSEETGGDDLASYAGIFYPNEPWDISIDYNHIGPEFNPELGFARQTGFDEWGVDASYSPDSEISFVRRTVHGMRTEYSVDEDWIQYQWSVDATPLGILFESGDYIEYQYEMFGDTIDEAYDIFQDVQVFPDRYSYGNNQFRFDSSNHRFVSFYFRYENGNFQNGTKEEFSAHSSLQLTRSLRFSLEGEIDKRKLPLFLSGGEVYGGEFTANLARTRLTYTFSPDMYITTLVQWENESENASANIRYNWTIQPERDLYVVLNLAGNREESRLYRADTSIKLGYQWRF